ncbi:MAG TPA: oxidoreductase, partial [Streptomyces sp.]|nr:oxidoreductase [Streptomyces sp.]
MQNRYDLHTREHDDVLGLCAREDIAFLPWFPPAHGTPAAVGSPTPRRPGSPPADGRRSAVSGSRAL